MSASISVAYVLIGLTTIFLLMDAIMKVVGASSSIEATGVLGFDPNTVRILGLVLLISTLLYAVPQTSMIGAILITGYLGGAIAVHLQHKSPLFSHVLFGLYLGIAMWGGLLLRSAALRALIPLIHG